MRPSRSARAFASSSHSLLPLSRPSQCRSIGPHGRQELHHNCSLHDHHQQHQPTTRRLFSSSPAAQAKRKPAHKSLSAKELQRISDARVSSIQPYTAAEKAELAKRYTPEQMAAIEAGEQAIDPRDLAAQGRTRSDPLAFKYLDDFAKIRPTIDKSIEKIRGEGQDYAAIMANSDAWKAAPDEIKDMEKVMDVLLDPTVPDGPDDIAAKRAMGIDEGTSTFEDHFRGLIGSESGEAPDSFEISDSFRRQLEDKTPAGRQIIDLEAYSEEERARKLAKLGSKPKKQTVPQKTTLQRLQEAQFDPAPSPDVAPSIPKINDPAVRWDDVTEQDPRAPDDETALAYVRLAKSLGQTVEQVRRYRTKSLVSHRVVNQTRMGKIQTMYVLCVAGDEAGMVGIGEGKSAEVDEAMRQAKLNAIRNMVPVRRYEGRTIFGEVTGKSGAVELCLRPSPPGHGLRCSSHIFEIARCAGISDLSAKILRSRNPMNVAKAVWAALQSQRDPEEVARGRGRKMVDVRKVYYAGLV